MKFLLIIYVEEQMKNKLETGTWMLKVSVSLNNYIALPY